MFLRQNGSFQSVKNPLKILILTIFFEGGFASSAHMQLACLLQTHAKPSTQKKAFTLRWFLLITTGSHPGILLFISVLAINPKSYVGAWMIFP